jgi:SAM-dependent methyltransferase
MSKPLPFKPGTIGRRECGAEGRPLEEYERKLAFDRSELVGKAVLDLGCGPGLKLDADLRAAGIGANVISFSPDFALSEHASYARTSNPQGTMVCGVGQNLPFRSGTFDHVFAVHVLDHLLSWQIYKDVVLEMGRVLAPGGIARMGTMLDYPDYPYPGASDLKSILQEQADELTPFSQTLAKMHVTLDSVDISTVESDKPDDFRYYNVPVKTLILNKADTPGLSL